MSILEIAPATVDDINQYAGDLPCYRAKCWAAKADGRVIALGGYGYHPNGAVVLFLDAEDGAQEQYRVALCKMARQTLASALDVGRPVIAECSDTIPAARRFLEWLGFTAAHGSIFEYKGNGG